MVRALCSCHQGQHLEFVPTACLLLHAVELHPADKEAIRHELRRRPRRWRDWWGRRLQTWGKG